MIIPHCLRNRAPDRNTVEVDEIPAVIGNYIFGRCTITLVTVWHGWLNVPERTLESKDNRLEWDARPEFAAGMIYQQVLYYILTIRQPLAK